MNNKDNLKENELLFWKVFRNIFLFKEILSKLKHYGYRDIVGVDFIINNYSNGMEVIKYNIESYNQHHHEIIMSERDIITIIKNIKKNNEETRSFYNLLFSTYSSTSKSMSGSTLIQLDKDTDKWIYKMIESYNYVALIKYIKYFKVESDVIDSLPINYSKLFKTFNYEKFKIFNYLQAIKSVTPIYIVTPGMIDLNTYLSFDNKFKKLIKSYKMVLDSNYFLLNQQNNINPNHIKYYNKLNQLVLELNQLKLNQFSDNQLNSTVKHLLISSSSTPETKETKEIIKKIYKSITLFFSCRNGVYNKVYKPLFYYIYYKQHKKIDKLYEFLNSIKRNNNNISSIGEIDSLLFFNSLFNDIYKEKKDKLELVSNMLDDGVIPFESNSSENYFNESFKPFCQVIFSSNDIEIIDCFLKKIKLVKREIYSNFSKIIIDNLQFIEKNQVLDYLFQNYRDDSGLFEDLNTCWEKIYGSKIEDNNCNRRGSFINHYENLMNSIGKRFSFGFKNLYITCNFMDFLNRAIEKPLIYSFNFDYCKDKTIESITTFIKNQDPIITFLSNAQLKEPIYFDHKLKRHTNRYKLIKFFFQNITKELIETKLKETDIYNTSFEIELTATISPSNNNNNNNTSSSSSSSGCSGSSSSKDVGYFIIGKTESFNFKISIKYLFICLCHLDRLEDIFYLYDSVPKVLFDDLLFNIYTEDGSFFSVSSSYHLEQIINYFIKNLNVRANAIDYLYHCLFEASKRGFIQIFKNIISNENQYLLKIKSNLNPSSLFDSQKLARLVEHSTFSYHFNLSNLLIEFIDFSASSEKELKTALYNRKLKLLKLPEN